MVLLGFSNHETCMWHAYMYIPVCITATLHTQHNNVIFGNSAHQRLESASSSLITWVKSDITLVSTVPLENVVIDWSAIGYESNSAINREVKRAICVDNLYKWSSSLDLKQTPCIRSWGVIDERHLSLQLNFALWFWTNREGSPGGIWSFHLSSNRHFVSDGP
jgi:hypothetical protein